MNNYFNATALIPNDKDGKPLCKVYEFLDNDVIQKRLNQLGKQPIISYGRFGGTQLPMEIKNMFYRIVVAIKIKI